MFIDDFRRKYTLQEVLGYLESISDLRVLVIGEAVIDEYIYGEVVGKTNKSPSLVFNPQESDTFAGVPMNIANHISDFCRTVDLKMMVGNDGKEDFISSHLNPEIGVQHYVWNAPTIVKRRYVVSYNNSKVFEVYDFKDIKFDDTKLVADLLMELRDYDIVIVGDSGHGMMTYDVRDVLKRSPTFLAVNTQTNAGNLGTHSARKYMDRTHDCYICVNQREFRLAVHEYWDRYDDIDELLRDNKGLFAVTMGPEGCKISESGACVTVPVFIINDVIDTVGAGDAFLSLTAPLLRINAPLDIVGMVGNVAGGLHSRCQGNKEHITKQDLYNHIREIMEG